MAFSQGHALLIGASAYQKAPSAGIPITYSDAEAIASVLSDEKTCGYPLQQVRILHGQLATRAGILSALDELAQDTRPQDTVFFFYAGHGLLGSDEGFHLVCEGSQVKDGRIVPGTGINESDLVAKIKAIPAEHVLMVINSGLSLLPGEEVLKSLALPAETVAALLSTGKQRAVITACQPGQESHIGNGLLTLFTQALFDGLRSGETRSADGSVNVFDLYRYIHKTVSRVVMDVYKQRQEPQLSMLKGTEPFVVAQSEGRVEPVDATAVALQEKVASERVEALRGNTAVNPGLAEPQHPEFTEAMPAPEGATREVEPGYSEKMLDQVTRMGHTRVHDVSPITEHEQATKGSEALAGHDTENVPTYFTVGIPNQQMLVDVMKQIRRVLVTSSLYEDDLAIALGAMDQADMQLSRTDPQMPVIQQSLQTVMKVFQRSKPNPEQKNEMDSLNDQAKDLASHLYQ